MCMKPWVPLVASAAIVAVTWVRCPGCLDRSRLNESCEWTGDTTFPLDPNNPTHQQRLVHDAPIFALNNLASTEAIRDRLTKPPSDAAVRARLVGLEGKGTDTSRGMLDTSTRPRSGPPRESGRRPSNTCVLSSSVLSLE